MMRYPVSTGLPGYMNKIVMPRQKHGPINANDDATLAVFDDTMMGRPASWLAASEADA